MRPGHDEIVFAAKEMVFQYFQAMRDKKAFD